MFTLPSYRRARGSHTTCGHHTQLIAPLRSTREKLIRHSAPSAGGGAPGCRASVSACASAISTDQLPPPAALSAPESTRVAVRCAATS